MSHLPTLITDLALILASAGLMTLIFKRLKQPSVLGYIVAGILAGPHITLTPTVIDSGNIQTWADIGVVFLLFALGLEFSFKKLMKVGGPAIIAALTIIVGMVVLGFIVGVAMGWKQMDSIFLGGMLAMSSTSIIYKAFEDLGLRTQRFTGLVFGILVIEDLVAIVLMVMLSTMAVSKNFEGMEMVYSIGKLLFFLLLWFLTGIYIIPTFFRRTRLLMGDETLLIVSLGLCFLMVVFATAVGFSSALGAFEMGSILAETIAAGINRTSGETGERFVCRDIFCFSGDDGRSGDDRPIYLADCDYYAYRFDRTVGIRYPGSGIGRSTAEDGFAVGILSDADRGVRFYYRRLGHDDARDQ